MKSKLMILPKEIQFETNSRNFPVFVSYEENSDDLLQMFDMPTTLGSVDKAIELYMRKGHIGKSSEQRLLEERELRNFGVTLQNLISNDAFCKDSVIIISENDSL